MFEFANRFTNSFRRLSVRRPRAPRMLGALLLLAVTGLGGYSPTACAQGQSMSLDGVVPLSALETPTDDLIRLATSYADAFRELKIARLNIETVNKLRPNAVVTNLEVQIASLNLEAAQRKVQILRAIIEKQLAAAEDKLEIIKYLETLGDPAAGRGQNGPNERSFIRAQDEATVRILKLILAMD